MILIISDDDEPTTDWIIDWLYCFNKKFVRLSETYPIKIRKIYEQNKCYECVFDYTNINGEVITVDTLGISAYWYRRSHLKIAINQIKSCEDSINITLNNYNTDENISALKILYFILSNKKHINHATDCESMIKLNALQQAKNIGIRVPDTLICCDKKTLQPFYDKHNGNLITKTIGDPTALFHNKIYQFTNKVNIDKVPEVFGLTLFQEMVEKFVELRIFYLDGDFYGSAIFSQLDKQTKIDFRNYNNEKPNRVVPYKLPYKEQEKFHQLMRSMGLNSGSFDIILTPSFKYIFLEVNPVGQFEQVSVPCNYNLSKIVAKYL